MFSRVGRSDTDCFSICFYDSQRLERIRHKLQKSTKILQNSFDVAEGCKEYISLLKETLEPDTKRASITGPNPSPAPDQVPYPDRVPSLKANRGNSRNRKHPQFSLSSNNSTRLILFFSQTVVALTQQAREDGRLAKTITFVAMLYLPASLVAVSYWSPTPTLLRNRNHLLVANALYTTSLLHTDCL